MVKTIIFQFCMRFKFAAFNGKLILLFMLLIAPTSHNNRLHFDKDYRGSTTYTSDGYTQFEEDASRNSASTNDFYFDDGLIADSVNNSDFKQIIITPTLTNFKSAAVDQTNFFQKIFNFKHAFVGETSVIKTAPTFANPTSSITRLISTNSISDYSTTTIPIDYSAKESDSNFVNADLLWEDNEYSTPPTCEELPVRKDEMRCPNDLIFVEPYYCYKLIENVNYYTECPYNNYLPYYSISRNILSDDKIKKTSIWIRATRNITKSCFDNFHWTEPGEYFGSVISVILTNCAFGCVTVTDGSFTGTSCNANHNHLCVYRYRQHDFCNKNLANQMCILSHLDYAKSTCYCYMNTSQNACKKLAEPKEPFQTQMLLAQSRENGHYLVWFGLKKLPDSQFIWKSSQELIDYSYWIEGINCEYTSGALKFAEKNAGWTLENEESSNFSICEFSLPRANVELQLKLSGTANELYLFIANPLMITNNLEELNCYCFNDANDDNFIQKIPLSYTQEKNKMVILKTANYPSQYWCNAFQFPENKVIRSNTIITYNRLKEYGYEYAIYISIKTSDVNFVRNREHIVVCESLRRNIQSKSNNSALSLRPIKIVETSQSNGQLDLLAHLTTMKTSRSQAEEYNLMYNILSNSGTTIPEFLSSDVCLSTTSPSLDNKILVWPETRIGTTVVPSNLLCLDKSNNLKPVIRKCAGNVMEGARWLKPEGNCLSDDSEYSNTTKELFSLMNKPEINDEDVTKLVHITESGGEQISADVYFISSLIKKVPEKSNKIEAYKIINNMMNYETSVLNDAQNMLNATDDVLYTLDTWLQGEVQTSFTLPNIIFRIADLNDAIGMSLNKLNNATNSFESFELVSWTSLEQLPSANLEAAVFFSKETVDEIKNAVKSKASLKLIVLMFYTSALFNEPEDNVTKKQLENKIVTILIPGFSGYLDHPIRIVYKLFNSTEKMCSYWKFGWDDLMVSTQGRWDEKGEEPVNYKKFDVCDFFHMTHFGLLLGGKYVNAKTRFILKFITALGLGLSMAGIFPIFITFAMFKVWRARSSNIILVNFCFVITLETVVMIAMDSVNEDGVVCKLMGAILHYLVLSEFFWMFAIGLLQYRRFVHVLKPPYKNIIIKCCFIGWVLPCVPIFVIGCISTDNYGINESKFCYAIGTYTIWFGLYLPILIVLISNIFIFISIFMSMSKTSVNTEGNTASKSYKLKMYLALLLFFILGMTWIFGFLGIFTNEITFIYLFCATATLRGFVLFLYFIVMHKDSVLMWKKKFLHYRIYLRKRLSCCCTTAHTKSQSNSLVNHPS